MTSGTESTIGMLQLQMLASISYCCLYAGSVATGGAIASHAARSIKRCSLELGGKSPAVLLESCNVAEAMPWLVMGGFSNAGQVCSATSRVLIHRSRYDEALEALLVRPAACM